MYIFLSWIFLTQKDWGRKKRGLPHFPLQWDKAPDFFLIPKKVKQLISSQKSGILGKGLELRCWILDPGDPQFRTLQNKKAEHHPEAVSYSKRL